MYTIHVVCMTVIACCVQFTGSTTEDTRQCHPNYYHWPRCRDHPDGYSCECGPGFVWNTKTCVARGFNSRLEFAATKPERYVLLQNTPIPDMTSFSITLWLKLYRQKHPGTVLSYADFKSGIVISSGPFLTISIQGAVIQTQLAFNQSQWAHLALTWTASDNAWAVYLNGGQITRRGKLSHLAGKHLKGGGELTLGQAPKSEHGHQRYDTSKAFLGEMGFVNLWQRAISETEVTHVYNDCIYNVCGDTVEWSDFRSGTHGPIRMRWPSRIFGNSWCFTSEQAAITCDNHCSRVIGVQCKAETMDHVVWPRTPVDHDAIVPCPGYQTETENATRVARRTCYRSGETHGRWGEPEMDPCTGVVELSLKTTAQRMLTGIYSDGQILALAEKVRNLTSMPSYRDPVTISTLIDTLHFLLRARTRLLDMGSFNKRKRLHGLSRELDKQLRPTLKNTFEFNSVIVHTFSNLLARKNQAGWASSAPSRELGDKFFLTIERFSQLVADSFRVHLLTGELTFTEDEFSYSAANMVMNFRLQRHAFRRVDESVDISNMEQRPPVHVIAARDHHGYGQVYLPENSLQGMGTTEEVTIVSAGFYQAAGTLPNHDLKRRSKEDNVNTALFTIFIHQPHKHVFLTKPVSIELTYLDTFNISNPECVNLRQVNNTGARGWSRVDCTLIHATTTHAYCKCTHAGVFAATTDMYDVNWRPDEVAVILLDIPSYVGCFVSVFLCFISVFMLIYLRTSSKTATIHKNFAIAIICSQLSFIFGIDRFQHKMICQIFALSLHYFFLATFLWLMNEAFNLYIVITYAAHSHGESTEGGSQYRYFILGWVQPAVLVAIFVGMHQDNYYASDMCWISWQYLWLFIGPVIGFLIVILLVLIFTAKEQKESSYSKNEKANKMITIHSKALWTQTILLSLSWCFAFISIKMSGIIIKILFCLFNILQGAFFLVFYFLLEDEVRTFYKARIKKRVSSNDEFDCSFLNSNDECYPLEQMPGCSVDKDNEDTSPKNDKKKRKPTSKKSQIEASSDESDESDSAMMIGER